MNKTITVENFKCFAEKKKIELGKITVCAGMNSVGKSSLIQSFLLVRQVFDAARLYRNTAVRNKVKFIRQVKEKKGYREIAMEFQRDSGIECSPQGDKKGLKILMREFVNERTGKKETVNCELHTKFRRYNIDRDKQDRIYFAPAREGICADKVIVIHIGDHLR